MRGASRCSDSAARCPCPAQSLVLPSPREKRDLPQVTLTLTRAAVAFGAFAICAILTTVTLMVRDRGWRKMWDGGDAAPTPRGFWV